MRGGDYKSVTCANGRARLGDTVRGIHGLGKIVHIEMEGRTPQADGKGGAIFHVTIERGSGRQWTQPARDVEVRR